MSDFFFFTVNNRSSSQPKMTGTKFPCGNFLTDICARNVFSMQHWFSRCLLTVCHCIYIGIFLSFGFLVYVMIPGSLLFSKFLTFVFFMSIKVGKQMYVQNRNYWPIYDGPPSYHFPSGIVLH